MRAGKMDRRITIQQKSVTQDGYGDPVESWSDLATVWAEKIENNGQERFQSSQFIGKAARSFKIRWSSVTKAITTEHRVMFESVEHEIVALREVGRHEGILIDCTVRSENPVSA